MEDKKRYQLLYSYLLARIHFGFYPEGECLPSIYRLSELFGVSTMTCRKAIWLLQEKGYLTSEPGQRPMVANPDSFDEPPACNFVSEGNLYDLYRSLYLLLPSVFYHGLTLCGEIEREEFRQILERPCLAWDEPTIQFLAYMLRPLHNPLLMDLFYDAMLYSYPSHLKRLSIEPGSWKTSYQVLYQSLGDMLALQEQGNLSGLWMMLVETYPIYEPPWATLSPAKAEDPCRFGKAQACNSIASDLIYRIYHGEYPAGSFLPGAETLARERSSAVITTRRAIALLDNLGVTETINGRGTRVRPRTEGAKAVHWTEPTVKKNILSELWALHILAMTCREVALALFDRISEEDRRLTSEEVLIDQREGRAEFVHLLCLDLLAHSSDMEALRSIYSNLRERLIWGYPLSYLSPRPCLAPSVDQVVAGLENGDRKLFAAGLEEMVTTLFLSSRAKAISVGIKEAQRIAMSEFPAVD